jgi:hypothetical protein
MRPVMRRAFRCQRDWADLGRDTILSLFRE